ncbi:hypothetical protein PhCBS80983_g06491, partial [Powellomyces hirtus]
HYAEIAAPLSALQSVKATFIWTLEHQVAFEAPKKAIISAPVLATSDPDNYINVYTDASGYATSGWLGQPHNQQPLPSPLPKSITGMKALPALKPVLFFSRKMLPAETRYPVHEQELLALVKFLRGNRFYLINRPFIAFIDHKSLIHLQEQPYLSKRQAGWVELLQEFDFKVEYLPGRWNTVADILSRTPAYAPRCVDCNKRLLVSSFINAIPLPWPAHTSEMDWATHVRNDDYAQEIFLMLDETQEHAQPSRYKRFSRSPKNRDILIYEEDRLYVPETLRPRILLEYHDALPNGGHMGEDATYAKLLLRFFWPKMQHDVRSFIRTCQKCRAFTSPRKNGFLRPLPIPNPIHHTQGFDLFSLPDSRAPSDTPQCL